MLMEFKQYDDRYIFTFWINYMTSAHEKPDEHINQPFVKMIRTHVTKIWDNEPNHINHC